MDGRLNFPTRLFSGTGRSAAHCGMIVMVVNLVVDLLYGLINPHIATRINHDRNNHAE